MWTVNILYTSHSTVGKTADNDPARPKHVD